MMPLWFILVFLFLLGLIVGSFLNVLIWRIPEGEEVVQRRSHCRHCARILEWYELIPLWSFVVLGGRCRSCKERISLQYPLVELSSGVLFSFTYWWMEKRATEPLGFLPNVSEAATQFSITGLFPDVTNILAISYALFAICVFLVIFVTDVRHFLIPDRVMLPAIALFSCLILANRFIFACGIPTVNCSLPNVAGSLVGAAFFLLLIIISRGVWMGLGDVKLAVFMGLFLGFWNVLVALLLASFSGSLVGLALILVNKKTLKSEVPFGAFLAPAAIAAFFFGDAILKSVHLAPFRW
ncbi:MAG: prepilin peptidase [bacterium]|nr:prepilin peptidase [bacterium]